jgi:hypothetical protein
MARRNVQGSDLLITWPEDEDGNPGKSRGYMLYRDEKTPAITQVKEETAEGGALISKRDLPRIYADLSGGAFYSRAPVSRPEDAIAPPIYAHARFGRCRDPNIFLPAGQLVQATVYSDSSLTTPVALSGPPRLSFDLGGHTYFLCRGGDAIKSPNGTGIPYRVANLQATSGLRQYTDAGGKTATTTTWSGTFDPEGVASFNESIYISTGSFLVLFDAKDHTGAASDAHWYVSETAKAGPAASVYWVVNSVGRQYFVAQDRNTSGKLSLAMYTSGDPMKLSSYTKDRPVGDTTYPITGVVATNRVAWFPKTNGIHSLDSRGYTPNWTPYWQKAVSADNGKKSFIFGSYLYAWHQHGLDRLDLRSAARQDAPKWVTPGDGRPNETPIRGRGLALSQDGPWLAAIVKGKDGSHLGYGRDNAELGIQRPGMTWHFDEAYVAGKDLTFLALGATPNDAYRRIWMGGADPGATTGPVLYYQYLPRYETAMAEYLAADPMPFHTTCELTYPITDVGDANAKKTIRRFDVQTEGLPDSPSIKFAVSTRVDSSDEADWAELGDADISPRSTIEPTEDFQIGHQIGIRVAGTGTTAGPPILRALRMRVGFLPETVPARRYTLLLADGVTRPSGGRIRGAPARQWKILRTLFQAGPVELHDRLLGEHLTVRVEQDPELKLIEDTHGKGTIAVAVLEVSILADQEAAIYDDDVSDYDGGSTHG